MDLANCTLKIYILLDFFASVQCLCKRKNPATNPLLNLLETLYCATTHVAPCCDLCFARPMLRLCATHVATLRDSCCDFARLMLRLCATHIATLHDSCCDIARPMLRLCATHVETLRDSCCDFARLKLRLCTTHVATLRDPCCDFVGLMLRLCMTQIDYVATLHDPSCDFVRLKRDDKISVESPFRLPT